MYTEVLLGLYVFAILRCTDANRRAEKEKKYESMYDKSQVWRSPITHRQYQIFKEMDQKHDIDIWNVAALTIDYLIQPDREAKVMRLLKSWNLTHSVLINDIQPRINRYKPRVIDLDANIIRTGHRLDFGMYPTLEIIEEYLDFLVKNYPICKLHSIGVTAENRTIKMLTISNNNAKNEPMVLQAGVHAREWIGIAALLYIVDEIVTRFGKQPSVIWETDWYVIPVLNPDGFKYTHTKDRLWRKNRRKFRNGCVGVDINRNFESNFYGDYRETDPCLQGYSGQSPYSERESKALHNMISKMKKRPKAFVDIHSYGQLILYPWAAKKSDTPDVAVHRQMAEGMIKEIKKATHEVYDHGRIYSMVHPATGVAIDWVYSTGIKHAYAIETRNKGKHGFLLPPEQIRATGNELYAAIKFLLRHVNSVTHLL